MAALLYLLDAARSGPQPLNPKPQKWGGGGGVLGFPLKDQNSAQLDKKGYGTR